MRDLKLIGGTATVKKENKQKALEELQKLIGKCCPGVEINGINGKPFADCDTAEIKAKTAEITACIEVLALEKHLKKYPVMSWQPVEPLVESEGFENLGFGNTLTIEERTLFGMHDRDAKSLRHIPA